VRSDLAAARLRQELGPRVEEFQVPAARGLEYSDFVYSVVWAAFKFVLGQNMGADPSLEEIFAYADFVADYIADTTDSVVQGELAEFPTEHQRITTYSPGVAAVEPGPAVSDVSMAEPETDAALPPEEEQVVEETPIVEGDQYTPSPIQQQNWPGSEQFVPSEIQVQPWPGGEQYTEGEIVPQDWPGSEHYSPSRIQTQPWPGSEQYVPTEIVPMPHAPPKPAAVQPKADDPNRAAKAADVDEIMRQVESGVAGLNEPWVYGVTRSSILGAVRSMALNWIGADLMQPMTVAQVVRQLREYLSGQIDSYRRMAIADKAIDPDTLQRLPSVKWWGASQPWTAILRAAEAITPGISAGPIPSWATYALQAAADVFANGLVSSSIPEGEKGPDDLVAPLGEPSEEQRNTLSALAGLPFDTPIAQLQAAANENVTAAAREMFVRSFAPAMLNDVMEAVPGASDEQVAEMLNRYVSFATQDSSIRDMATSAAGKMALGEELSPDLIDTSKLLGFRQYIDEYGGDYQLPEAVETSETPETPEGDETEAAEQKYSMSDLIKPNGEYAQELAQAFQAHPEYNTEFWNRVLFDMALVAQVSPVDVLSKVIDADLQAFLNAQDIPGMISAAAGDEVVEGIARAILSTAVTCVEDRASLGSMEQAEAGRYTREAVNDAIESLKIDPMDTEAKALIDDLMRYGVNDPQAREFWATGEISMELSDLEQQQQAFYQFHSQTQPKVDRDGNIIEPMTPEEAQRIGSSPYQLWKTWEPKFRDLLGYMQMKKVVVEDDVPQRVTVYKAVTNGIVTRSKAERIWRRFVTPLVGAVREENGAKVYTGGKYARLKNTSATTKWVTERDFEKAYEAIQEEIYGEAAKNMPAVEGATEAIESGKAAIDNDPGISAEVAAQAKDKIDSIEVKPDELEAVPETVQEIVGEAKAAAQQSAALTISASDRAANFAMNYLAGMMDWALRVYDVGSPQWQYVLDNCQMSLLDITDALAEEDIDVDTVEGQSMIKSWVNSYLSRLIADAMSGRVTDVLAPARVDTLPYELLPTENSGRFAAAARLF